MAHYQPQTVYRRKLEVTTTELPQFSTKPSINVESEIKKLDSLKKFRKAYDDAVAEIKAHAESEQTANTLVDLKDLSEFLDFYAPIVSAAKDSQKELVMKFLLEGKELEDIKNAVGNSTSWLTIEAWAGTFKGIGPKREFVEWVVPTSLGERIRAKVEETKEKNAKKSKKG